MVSLGKEVGGARDQSIKDEELNCPVGDAGSPWGDGKRKQSSFLQHTVRNARVKSEFKTVPSDSGIHYQ